MPAIFLPQCNFAWNFLWNKTGQILILFSPFLSKQWRPRRKMNWKVVVKYFYKNMLKCAPYIKNLCSSLQSGLWKDLEKNSNSAPSSLPGSPIRQGYLKIWTEHSPHFFFWHLGGGPFKEIIWCRFINRLNEKLFSVILIQERHCQKSVETSQPLYNFCMN